jgi:hypothetical protein
MISENPRMGAGPDKTQKHQAVQTDLEEKHANNNDQQVAEKAQSALREPGNVKVQFSVCVFHRALPVGAALPAALYV